MFSKKGNMFTIQPYKFPDGIDGFAIFRNNEKVAGPFQSKHYAQLQLIKLGLIKKETDPNPDIKPLDPNSPIIIKLQYIVKVSCLVKLLTTISLINIKKFYSVLKPIILKQEHLHLSS